MVRREVDSRSSDGVARHGKLGPAGGGVSSVLKWFAVVASAVLVASVGIVAVAVWDVAKDVKYVVIDEGSTQPIPNIGAYKGPINMLVVGGDSRKGQKGHYTASGKSAALADVIILLHINADHKSAAAISFPRDLLVPVPACPRNDGTGGSYSAMSSIQINSTIQYGGVGCTVKTIESITGVSIPFAAMFDFNGVIEMSNAVGGVDVCSTTAVSDKDSGLNIPAGTSTLKGSQALAFLRTRHGFADGSDLGRISAQQVYLSSLVRKISSNGTLSNPVKLFGLASAAAQNVQLSQNLANVDAMMSLAKAGAGINPKNIVFMQIPVQSVAGSGRVALNETLAPQVFEKLQNDVAFALNPKATTGRGSVETTPSASASPKASSSASASASPSESYLDSQIQGQDASQVTCAKGNG